MYSREKPSERQRELWKLYSELHGSGESRLGLAPERTYPGVSLLPHIDRIRRLVRRTDSRNLLDYGAGKGFQYSQGVLEPGRHEGHDCVLDYWDVDAVHCYDPCYPPLSKLPEGRFDGVITTDVLEHCAETDVPWIVDEIFGYAERFIFACIACYPAKTTLPNGENAHCTLRSPQWWAAVFEGAARRRPGPVYEVWVQELATGGDRKIEESCFGTVS